MTALWCITKNAIVVSAHSLSADGKNRREHVFTSSRNNVQICLKGQRRVRPAGNDFSPATLDCVNQLIQRPTEELAQQSVLATSLTRSP
ncbi:Uncharacterised protein [Salmonella enterica subsp. enterica]|uniref:Uncharacterized protein n=1 Tax=Salmonella enterica I TaxID=59201 RepID=A0A379W060_SALET|nr:Uncharacterised protein [Salmonella enterica subsp. enterica]